jgi:hypothetical protein
MSPPKDINMVKPIEPKLRSGLFGPWEDYLEAEMPPALNPSRSPVWGWMQQELAAVTFKEYALQDGNTLEATQTMLESRVISEFPLNDQEILLRHLHWTAGRYVADHQQRQPGTPVPVSVLS